MLSIENTDDDDLYEKTDKQVSFKMSNKRNIKEIENREMEQEHILALITQSNKVTQSINSEQDHPNTSSLQGITS